MIDKQTNTNTMTDSNVTFAVKPVSPVANKRNALQLSNINFYQKHYGAKYFRFYDLLGVCTWERNDRFMAAFFWRDRKNPESYYYTSDEKRTEGITRRIKEAKAYADRIAARKSKKTDYPEINVGDCLATSWGYEQTNVEFYQVVKRSGKTKVVLRRVASKTIEETSWCSANITPVKDAFISEEEDYRISRYGVKIHSSATARKTDWDSSHHKSWGY